MDILNRTFVGIPIPPDAYGAIERATLLIKRKPGVENIRWNQPSELVISIASLGELGPETINSIRLALPPVIARFPAMNLSVKGFSGLPNMIQPRYCIAEVEGDNGALSEIAAAVDYAVTPFLPQRDIKAFRPYIVLGRLKTESEPIRVALGRALKLLAQPEITTLPITSVDLLISKASTSGIVYDVVQRMPLGG